MSSLRQVQAGRPYALPPPAPGIDPDACPDAAEWRRVITLAAQQQAQHGRSGSLVEGCVRAFRGVSPALVRELCAAAGVDGSAPPQALPEPAWGALHAQWAAWLGRLASGSFAASSCPGEGTYSVLGGGREAEGSVLRMLGRYYARLQAHEQFEQAGGALGGRACNGCRAGHGCCTACSCAQLAWLSMAGNREPTVTGRRTMSRPRPHLARWPPKIPTMVRRPSTGWSARWRRRWAGWRRRSSRCGCRAGRATSTSRPRQVAGGGGAHDPAGAHHQAPRHAGAREALTVSVSTNPLPRRALGAPLPRCVAA